MNRRLPDGPMYDHADKAGNRADVWKHFILLSVVQTLVERRAFLGDPIHYVESHAGAGRYPLVEGGAWEEGAGRLLGGGPSRLASLSQELRTHPYIHLLDAAAHPERGRPEYHGSWYLVGQYLESEVVPYSMDLCEASGALAAVLCADLESGRLWPGVSVHNGDGYALAAQRPEANLLMLDPPYVPDAAADWSSVTETVRGLTDAAASYLVWYPLSAGDESRSRVAALYAGAGAAASGAELRWAASQGEAGLAGCGMLAAGAAGPILAEWTRDGSGVMRLLAEALAGEMHPITGAREDN